MSEDRSEFAPEGSRDQPLPSEDAGQPFAADRSFILFDMGPDEAPKDGKTESKGGLFPCVRKAACPALAISGMGFGGLVGSRVGLSWLDAASPWLVTFAALTCYLRGLVHVSQDKLIGYPRAMRYLTMANLPVTVLWAVAAAIAIRWPDSIFLPAFLSAACVALALLAALQGIVVIKLREGRFKNTPAYPDVALGTEKVAALEIFGTGVTMGELVGRARELGRIIQVRTEQAVSVLVLILLVIGALLVGHELRTNLQPATPNPAVIQPVRPPTPTPTSPAPIPRPSESLIPAAPPAPTTTAEPEYDDLCLKNGVEPGTGAPEWAGDKLNDAWFGPGGQVAGCAQEVHTIEDKACPSAWEVGVDAVGDTVSVAVAARCQPRGAIYLGYSAVLVQDLLADNHALGGSCRRQVGAGDVQLVYGSFGTIALVRPDGVDNERVVNLPPAATAGWAQLIARRAMMVWPRQRSSTTWDFVDEWGHHLDASVHVTFTGGDSRLAQTGSLTDHGVSRPIHSGQQDLTSLTPGAPGVCR